MARRQTKIAEFDFAPGRSLGGKYTFVARLGSGYEGEVYQVVERKTGIHRAAKVFYPQRNVRDRAVRFYATKLERLRRCSIITQYHHSETIRYRKEPVTCLISDLVEGEILASFLQRLPGKRMRPFEAMHLIHSLASGLAEIHRLKEYHGDVHEGNIVVLRRGIRFFVKLIDFYHHGPSSAMHLRDDVVQLVEVFHLCVGGRRHYASQPDEVKSICRGLRRDLIWKSFPTADHLREHLESFRWTDD